IHKGKKKFSSLKKAFDSLKDSLPRRNFRMIRGKYQLLKDKNIIAKLPLFPWKVRVKCIVWSREEIQILTDFIQKIHNGEKTFHSLQEAFKSLSQEYLPHRTADSILAKYKALIKQNTIAELSNIIITLK